MGRTFDRLANGKDVPHFQLSFSEKIPKSLKKMGFDEDLENMSIQKMKIQDPTLI